MFFEDSLIQGPAAVPEICRVQTKSRKPFFTMSRLGWIITPEMIAILLISLYVIHWFIYPEALEYVMGAAGHSGELQNLPKNAREFGQIIHLVGDKRALYACLESGIGMMQTVMLSALLIASLLYIYKLKRNRRYVRTCALPLAAVILKIPYVILFAEVLLDYPDYFGFADISMSLLRWSTIVLYVMTIVVVAAGILDIIRSGSYRR